MAVKTIEELFIHALSDIYNAKKQLIKAAEPLTVLGGQP
jgi:ferritin-like metal-binding protein YciE